MSHTPPSCLACIARAQLVQFRKWPIQCGARLLLPPCQLRRFVRGTLLSCASLTGSPPCAFLALLVSGVEILISHPRFYWGEAGNVLNSSVVQTADSSLQSHRPHRLRLRASRPERLEPLSPFPIRLGGGIDRLTLRRLRIFPRTFPAEFASRSRRSLLAGLSTVIAQHLRLRPAREEEAWSYNVLQRLTYLLVIFVLFPLVIWTGLAMSPAIASAFPAAVTVLGGQQSARTIHFFVSVFLVLFLLVHVAMVCLTGFRNRMRAMITGRPARNGYGASMSRISRRKLITTGLISHCGRLGLARLRSWRGVMDSSRPMAAASTARAKR
jgi:nitrate reductase NapE component